ncbi:MAG: cell division protein FtsA [Patescibacteria group bacterium]|nr:cell division protein FtsA [Patescibacteria group bacterium]
MAKNTIVTGLDVGTCYIRAIVAKIEPGKIKPQIIGIGQAPSFGLRKGVVVDVEETIKNIKQSVREAERTSGVPIEQVLVGISGSHITSKTNKGVVAISRADGKVSKEDIERVIKTASAISVSQNREILHVIPRSFSVDSQNGLNDPAGMTGVSLDVDALIVEGASPFIKNLTKCVMEAGLEIESMVLAPLAASRAVLNKRQKELGVLTLDLGGGTAGITVFEEGKIIHSCVLPVGSSHITNDIAIGLRSSIELAEKVKLEYGSALSSEIGKKENIDLSKLELNEKGIIPRAEVVKIVEARLSEILELANKELKNIDRQGLLPSGVVLLGGGAKMPNLVDLAKSELKLPVQIGFPLEMDGIVEEVDDPSFATAIGLVLWGMDNRVKSDKQETFFPYFPIRITIEKLKGWMRDFLP